MIKGHHQKIKRNFDSDQKTNSQVKLVSPSFLEGSLGKCAHVFHSNILKLLVTTDIIMFELKGWSGEGQLDVGVPSG